MKKDKNTHTKEDKSFIIINALASGNKWQSVDEIRRNIGINSPKINTLRKKLIELEKKNIVQRKIEKMQHGFGPMHLWSIKPNELEY